MFTLRPYQQNACDAALGWIKSSIDPCMIDAAPAAGKSFMVAYLAINIRDMANGGRVLCLQPSAELTKQNYEKYLLTGEKASIFSSSAGAKSTKHPVIYATPKTVSNSISRFKKTGDDRIVAVLVDECHGITPTIIAVIDEIRKVNPNLRVIGFSGTPYRLGSGYIYQIGSDGRSNGEDTCVDPYFKKCVYRVSAQEMLAEKFITPMKIGAINATAYDTSGIILLPNGTFNTSTVEQAFEGHGRETASIVADVIAQSRNIIGGVMLFAATVRHAEEIMASLPPENSGMVTGSSSTMKGRACKKDDVIKAYRDKDFRYLVSVGQLTTGFDVSHTAVIALLRYTESAALLIQILGRAWRLDDAKLFGLLLDYAGNVDFHFPDGDIYSPQIRASKIGEGGGAVNAACPDCGYQNEFKRNMDTIEYELNENGYCVDLRGHIVKTDDDIPISGHHGRRCFGERRSGPKGEYERCNYRWAGKECPNCSEKNDIAARFCYECKHELVNPNDKLISDFKALKRDPTQTQTDRIVSMSMKHSVSNKGNKTCRVDFVTTFRQFSVYYMPESTNPKFSKDWMRFSEVIDEGNTPSTITYAKDPVSGFFRVHGYNMPEDDMPRGYTPTKKEAERMKAA